jgi:eukaryotic-like serine/threonine-protein kinase
MFPPADPSDNLLFGLLALQNGLIDEARLFDAFQAWTLDKGRPLAEHLVATGHLDVDDRNAVEALVARHLNRHGGSAEGSLATIAAGNSIREGLTRIGDAEVEATLSLIGTRATPSYVEAADGPTQDASADANGGRTDGHALGMATSDGQRFRILRPHAKGGLGAVFVAMDTELHREVALKQILDAHADRDISRQRFLLEAEITGGLEHPGIVPVYGLGTYGDGRPYYAMRFVRGDSLKEVIDRFHSDPALKADPGRRSLELRQLLRRFTDVCNAIEYAHSRGVLHRDIKPANVIVGRYGETLVVDWGVAKAVGRSEPGSSAGEGALIPSSSSGSSETLPGNVLGTPSFMSPEQADGLLERLGPASDVYSLGTTLYCLLTGVPPFGGKVTDVLDAVRRGEFPPPRQLDPSIDPALEAVCKKAMAREPADRYATPRALAEDIERWTADEPVSTWREPLSRRARRWARRNRTAVTGAAAAVLAGVVGLAAVLFVQTRAKADLARSLANETRANAELARSRAAVQARYDLAVEAIRTFHTGVSEDFLLKQDRFKELRDRLLKSASDFYGKLGALLGRESDAASRRALAGAYFEVAELTAKVGRPEDALASHREVLAVREALAAEPGAGDAIRSDVGRSLTAIGMLLESTGRTDLALASYREAERRLAAPEGSEPDATVRAALAACRSQLGWLLKETGHAADALSVLRLARADQEALAGVVGAPDGARNDLATTVSWLGVVLRETGKAKEAEAEDRKALAIRQALVDDNPAVTGFRRELELSHNNLALQLAETGKASEAEAEYRKALGIQRKLVDDNPAVIIFRSDLAMSHGNLGELLRSMSQVPEAEAEYREALAIRKELVEDNPAVTRFRSALAMSRRSLGALLAGTGKPSEAETEYREALAIQRKLVDDNPSVTLYRRELASSHQNIGNLLALMGKTSEAEVEFRAALAIQRKMADDNPSVAGFRSVLANTHNSLGFLLFSAGRASQAEAEYRAMRAIQQKLVDDNPTVTSHRASLANAGVGLATAQIAAGRDAEARDAAGQAVVLLEALLEREPGSFFYRAVLGEALLRRGQALLAGGDPAGAAADWRRMAAIYEKMSPEPELAFLEACCHAMLADAAGREGSGAGPTEAGRAMDILRRAVAMGFRSADRYRVEPALEPLRDREDFRLLMMDLAMPADPFAP